MDPVSFAFGFGCGTLVIAALLVVAVKYEFKPTKEQKWSDND